MHITRVTAVNFRRVRSAELAPGARLNLITGKNGSGKTSLLESIALLGSGRSFRTRRLSDVITHGEDSLTAFCEVVGRAGVRQTLGFERAAGKTRLRVDGEDARAASTLARVLPSIFIGPDCVRVLTEGAELRRRLLDWVMFHVEPTYLDVHQRFTRVLKQRNTLLREHAPRSDLTVWDGQLATLGEALNELRLRHADRLGGFASEFLDTLLPMPVELAYQAGWKAGQPLLEALSAAYEQDRRLGYTHPGPQRADLRVTTRGQPVRAVLSRGESRLLAMGLHLAQAAYFQSARNELPVLLIDDLGTELDDDSCARFMGVLDAMSAQAFVTTVTAVERILGALPEGGEGRSCRFHVERGVVLPMV